MKKRIGNILRPSSLANFLLLAILSLTTGPLVAQSSRPSCTQDQSVMSWSQSAANGTTFTMTKDCEIDKDGSERARVLWLRGRSFTIDGAGYTIYAADKAPFAEFGTAFGFDNGTSNSLTLRNLTIEGGGTARVAASEPDPAIVVRDGTLVLDGVTIRNTRGGAIRIVGAGKVLLKNSTFTGNQISGTGAATEGSVVTVYSGGRLFLQNLFTAKNNTGGRGAVYVRTGGAIDIYDMGCHDTAGNQDDTPQAAALLLQAGHPTEFVNLWTGKHKTTSNNCDANTASTTTANRPGADPTPPPTPVPTPIPASTPAVGGGNGNSGAQTTMGMGGEMDMKMSMADSNHSWRIKGTVGSDRSAYYRKDSGGVPLLQIYRVDSSSVGHWVMNVSQAAIDAVSGAGCVAASPDGRYALRVWADGNITISDGPDQEGKIFHNTLKGGVNGPVIATQTTYSSTPPGMGCPGYMG